MSSPNPYQRVALSTHVKFLLRSVMRRYFHEYEPERLISRKARRLKCKRFWAAGVNDIWAVDQHDKWQRFGLRLHTGLEPYSGKILWMRVWHTNSDPVIICSYYLNVVERLGCESASSCNVPVLTNLNNSKQTYLS